MTILILALVLVGFAVFAMNFNIIFRKGKGFPDGEVSHNKALRKEGIICAKDEEIRIWGKNGKKGKQTCESTGCGDCHSCGM